ncbi:adenine DNA glycosylase-like [Ostrea edulis]|uniref:adenine DNA glycosylase-like n=1 Tax=Ostrea edulis TaxID=37623 RepID=UPI0024AF178F|nr:adenine DNA glycosylase-like [Ostrea edulis]
MRIVTFWRHSAFTREHYTTGMVKRKLKEIVTGDGSDNGLLKPTIHDFKDEEKKEFQKSLVAWFRENQRDLPWRKQLSIPDVDQRAYAVWVSEIMLQQTQVATVIDYYKRWMKKWPTLQDLAKASLEEVNEMWAGLGYYSRGRRLLEGAQKVVKEFGGKMPKTAETLLKHLPGVGRYTAGAIASIAYGQATGIVDGNVIRVLCRMRIIGAYSTSQPVQNKLWSLADEIVDSDQPGDFNQGMMELGATVCTPKSPSCGSCPVQSLCLAKAMVDRNKLRNGNKLGVNTVKSIPDIECAADKCELCLPENETWDEIDGVQNYPRKPGKKAAREEKTCVCIVCKKSAKEDVQYFLVQRPQKGLLAGLWEFPSVKVEEDDENNDHTVREILRKSCGLRVPLSSQSTSVGNVEHIFSHIHQTYIVQALVVDEGDVDSSQIHMENSRWLTKEEFSSAAVSTAMKKVFRAFESSGTGKKKKSLADPDRNQKSITLFFKKK